MPLSPDRFADTLETMRAIPRADFSTIRDLASAVSMRAYEIGTDDASTLRESRSSLQIYDRYATRGRMEFEADQWNQFWHGFGVNAPSLVDFRTKHVDTDKLEVASNMHQNLCGRTPELVIAPDWSLQEWANAFAKVQVHVYVTESKTSELYGAEISPYNTIEYSWAEAAKILPYDPQFSRREHRKQSEIQYGETPWTANHVYVKDGYHDEEHISLSHDIPELHEALAIALRTYAKPSYKSELDGIVCYGKGFYDPGMSYVPAVIPYRDQLFITSTQLEAIQ